MSQIKSPGHSVLKLKGLFMLVIWILVVITSVYVAFMALIYIVQPKYVYFPERILLADPSSIGLDFESVSFETEDGVRLFGWFIPEENARSVVLFCMATRETSRTAWSPLKYFIDWD